MAWLNVHPEISHVVIAQHWSTRYDSKNVMDWKLKPLPSGEPAYSNSLRAFISELRAMGKQVILLAPTPLIKQNDVAKYIRNLIRRGETGKGLESLTCTRQNTGKIMPPYFPSLTVLNRKGSAPSCAYFPIYRKTGRSTPMNTGKSCTRIATTCPAKAPSNSSST